MGNRLASLLQPQTTVSGNTDTEDDNKDFKQLSVETGFTYRQIEQFDERFNELLSVIKSVRTGDRSHNTLTYELLLLIPEMKENPLNDRICKVFMNYSENQNSMTFREFVRVMAKFKTISSDTKPKIIEKRKEKIDFLFKIYDVDENKSISETDMCEILRKILPKIDPDKIKQNALKIIQEMAPNKLQVSLEDYTHFLAAVDIDTLFSLPFLKLKD